VIVRSPFYFTGTPFFECFGRIFAQNCVYSRNMKRITIRDVAREAGVSVTLVSFVMNAKMGKNGRLDCPVSPETAARVLEVAKRLGYKKNIVAASLRSGRSNTIAVITTDISNKFFAGVSRYIEDKAYEYGYSVIFGSSDENADRLDSLVEAMLSYNIDGIIIAPVDGGETAVQKLIDANVPVVLLDRDIEGIEGVGKVLLNDEEAGRMATELLIKGGSRKIEMLSYDLGISSLKQREAGYLKAMSDAGLETESNIHYTTYSEAESDAHIILSSAIERGVEAFFLPTYSLSAAMLLEIKHMNLLVPEDLAIVAFDKSNVYKIMRKSIAHIQQPLKDLGEKSVELLHNLIEGNETEKTFLLKPSLILGESSLKKQ